MSDIVSFGALLKGARLGFGWSGEHRCFIRVSDYTSQGRQLGWLIEIAPARGKFPKDAPHNPYRVWWETEEIRRATNSLAVLRDLFTPRQAMQFLVDDNGELL